MSDPRPKTKKSKKRFWPVKVFFLTFLLAVLMSVFSETTLLNVSMPMAIVALGVMILVGVTFDIIGIAVTTEDVSAYTAMASKKISGAKQAIRLVQSAGTVSNICNDVVGDICGIVSGSMGAAIAAKLVIMSSDTQSLLTGIAISSLIAAITVGSKALGKSVAINYSHNIVFTVGKVIAIFSSDSQKERK